MKIQEYCKVTERVKPDPMLKARIMKQAEQIAAGSAVETDAPQRRRIRRHISGRAIGGTAIAAAVAAANIGIIGAVMHRRNTAPAHSAASEIEEIKCSVPDYVQCMQAYYTKETGEPCSFDFTGYGTDLDYHWEFSDYKINLRAAAGDAFKVWFFYDVIPLKGQTYYGTDFNYEPLLCYVESETALTAFNSNRFDISLTESEEQGLKPDVLSITHDGENGGEVWHFYDYTTDPTGLGICGKEFFATVDSRFSEDTQNETYDSSNLKKSIELDFIQQPVWQGIDTTNAPEFAELGFTRAAVTPMNVMLSSGEHNAEFYESLLNFTTENEPHAELECLTVQLPCTAQTVNGAMNVEYTGAIGFRCRDASGRDDPLTMLLQMQTPLDTANCASLTVCDAVIPLHPQQPAALTAEPDSTKTVSEE